MTEPSDGLIPGAPLSETPPPVTPPTGPAPEPPPAAPADPPTVAWTVPPPASDTEWTRPSDAPPAAPGWGAPPPAPPPAMGWGTPPPSGGASGGGPTGPLISASTAQPTVAWAPPAVRSEVAPGLSYASTASRFAALIVDSVLLAIVAAIVASLFGGRQTTNLDGRLVSDPIYLITQLIVSAGYFILSWSGGRRATLGQRLFAIQVGNAGDGRSLTTEQAIKRWIGLGYPINLLALSATMASGASGLSFLWDLVLLLTTVTSATKQGLHDRFAGSAVVRPTAAGNGLVYTCLFLAVLLPILAVLAFIALIYVGAQTTNILSGVGTSI